MQVGLGWEGWHDFCLWVEALFAHGEMQHRPLAGSSSALAQEPRHQGLWMLREQLEDPPGSSRCLC